MEENSPFPMGDNNMQNKPNQQMHNYNNQPHHNNNNRRRYNNNNNINNINNNNRRRYNNNNNNINRRNNNYNNYNNNNYNNKNYNNNNNRRRNNNNNNFNRNRKRPMEPIKCQICETEDSKYKCPKCYLNYCSIPCFTKHKEIPCQKVEQNQNKSNNKQISVPKVLGKLDELKNLTPEQINSLESNENLKILMQENREIHNIFQHLLLNGDTTVNKICNDIEEIEKSSPVFVDYIQQLLETIGVRDKEGNCLL